MSSSGVSLADALQGIYVTSFGAVGDGVTDDTEAFERWVTALNSGGQLANGLGGTGFRGYIPPGNYNVPNGLQNPITEDAIVISGSVNGASVITTNSGSLFKWSSSNGFVKSGGARNITIRCTTPDVTQVCFVADFAGELTFQDIKVAKIGRILSAGGADSTRYASGIRFSMLRGTAYNLAAPVFDLRYGSGFYISDSDVVGDNVSYPTDTTSLHGAVTGRHWIAATTGGWDTISEVNVITNRFDSGLWIAPPAGASVVNIKLTNVWHDYNKTAAIKVAPVGGNVTKLDAVNCYLVATDSHGVHITASSGICEQINFTGCTSIFSGANNWRIEGAAVKHVGLINCFGIGADRLDGTNAGDMKDSLVVHCSDFRVLGGTYGEDGSPYNGIVNQARYGLTIDSTSDRYTIGGTKLTGTSGAQQNLQSHNTGGIGRSVFGLTTIDGSTINGTGPSVLAVPASGVTATHNLGITAVLYVSGGTVTGITCNGSATGLTAGAFTLAPGATWSIQYTVAPTVTRQLIAS